MKVSTHHAIRSIAAVLTYALTFTQFAHAAKLPRTLEQQQTTATSQSAAPIERQPPEQQDDAPDPPSPQSASVASETTAQARLLAAHNLYVADDGADEAFPLDPSYGYDRLIASLQSCGRYHLVSSVKDADLVLQLRSAVTTSVVDSADDTSASIYHHPYFRLTIADPATLKALWVITTPVHTGTQRKTNIDLFAQSANNVTSQLKLLINEPLTVQEQTALVQSYHHHHSVIAGIAVGTVVVGLAVAIPLILKAKFDADKESNEQKQHDFCVQNHIPNCPA